MYVSLTRWVLVVLVTKALPGLVVGTYPLLPAGSLRCSAAVGREIFQAVARLPSQKAIFRAPKVTNEYTCLKRKVDFRADAKKSKSSFWT